jgi:SAM-dependent methyltransferase
MVEYDNIAVEYKTSKQLSFRKYVESYTLFTIAGTIRSASILDLACGEGFYTRKLKRAGANDVMGVDLSPEMITLAEKAEENWPLGCRYEVYDVANMPILCQFDLVTAMYLLNYARSREELAAFCRAAFEQLRPGGRFLGVNDNPANNPAHYDLYRKYGFIKKSPGNRQEGDPIRYTFFNPDGTEFQFNNYYLSPETYEEVFTETGFVDFQWAGPFLDPSQLSNIFWLDFMAFPPIIGFSARKA